MGQKKSIAYAWLLITNQSPLNFFYWGVRWLALKITIKVWTFLHK